MSIFLGVVLMGAFFAALIGVALCYMWSFDRKCEKYGPYTDEWKAARTLEKKLKGGQK
jgi:hypothetical protein